MWRRRATVAGPAEEAASVTTEPMGGFLARCNRGLQRAGEGKLKRMRLPLRYSCPICYRFFF